jgi:anthranilate phosphoribosyltransferase
MPSLVNRQRRCLHAVVKERQSLADALARYMAQLGLERRAKEVDVAALFAGLHAKSSETKEYDG